MISFISNIESKCHEFFQMNSFKFVDRSFYLMLHVINYVLPIIIHPNVWDGLLNIFVHFPFFFSKNYKFQLMFNSVDS